MMGTYGQDWASYQDWSPSTTGLGFVIIKATEGTGYVNPRYASQLTAVRAGTAVPGHYHFVRPGGVQAQADFFLRKISLKPGDVIALDWEDAGVSGTDKDAWIQYVKAKTPGHKVILYCNRDFWINRDTTSYAGDGLWIADPDAPMGQPRVKAPWLIHQYGEHNGTDLDYSHLDAAALRAWAAGTTSTPTPPETDMPLTDADVARVALAVNAYRNQKDDEASVAAGHGQIPDVYGRAVSTNEAVGRIETTLAKGTPVTLTDAQVQQIAAALAANPAFVQALSTGLGKDIAARMQS